MKVIYEPKGRAREFPVTLWPQIFTVDVLMGVNTVFLLKLLE